MTHRFPLNSMDKEQVLEGEDAIKAKQLLRGVEIGTWADTVLTKFPRKQMSEKPQVLGLDANVPDEWRKDPKLWPSYVVLWRYPDFHLVIARGVTAYPKTYVYAVQRIIITKELADVEIEATEAGAGTAGRGGDAEHQPGEPG